MNVGFTGTRCGLTLAQRSGLIEVLKEFGSHNTFHHGDCVGADALAHSLIREMPWWHVVIHPPLNPKHRAFCQGVLRTPKTFLARNHDIVDESDILVACPYQAEEVLRSGTWATVRYARKKSKPVILVLPSGR